MKCFYRHFVDVLPLLLLFESSPIPTLLISHPFPVCFLPSSASDCLFPVAISYRVCRSLGSWYKRINMHFDLCLDGCSSSKYLFNTFIYQKLFIFLNWVDREIYFLEPSAILVVMSSLNHCERKFTKWSGDIMRSERQFITDPQGITGTAIKAVSVSSISRLTAKQNIIRYQLVERIGEEVIRVS